MSDADLDDLLHETFELIESGKPLVRIARRTVREERCNKKPHTVPGVTPVEQQHLNDVLRVNTQDTKKLEGGTLPPSPHAHVPAQNMVDEHGDPIPTHLQGVFAAREHFRRIREELTQLAKQIHALKNSPAGRDISNLCARRLLSVAEDLNLSCPALLETADKTTDPKHSKREWISAKVVLKRSYR
jgi:hypothetical protein